MKRVPELLDATRKHTAEAVRYATSDPDPLRPDFLATLEKAYSSIVCITYALSFLCQAVNDLASEVEQLRKDLNRRAAN